MKNAASEKMKSAVVGSQSYSAEQVLKVLKSDEYRLLSDYFEFEPRNLKIDVEATADGKVTFTVVLKSASFKDVGRVLD